MRLLRYVRIALARMRRGFDGWYLIGDADVFRYDFVTFVGFGQIHGAIVAHRRMLKAMAAKSTWAVALRKPT